MSNGWHFTTLSVQRLRLQCCVRGIKLAKVQVAAFFGFLASITGHVFKSIYTNVRQKPRVDALMLVRNDPRPASNV